MNDDKPEQINDIMETIRKAVIFGKAMPGSPDAVEAATDKPEPEPEAEPVSQPETVSELEPEAEPEPLVLADPLPDDEPANDAAEPAVPPPAAVLADSPPPMAPVAQPPVAIPGATTLEALVSAALEPLLKTWIDTHLPEIVETRVQAEIARLTTR